MLNARWQMTGLKSWRDQGYSITLYCPGYTTRPECHGWLANWDQLIQYFGLDAEIGRAQIFRVSECPVCGRHPDAMSLHPPAKNPDLPWRAWDWQGRLDEPLTEAQRRERQQLEEHRALMDMYAKAAREQDKAIYASEQAKMKAQRQIDEAREKGVFLIGPPNPHQHKKHRPRMKG